MDTDHDEVVVDDMLLVLVILVEVDELDVELFVVVELVVVVSAATQFEETTLGLPLT